MASLLVLLLASGAPAQDYVFTNFAGLPGVFGTNNGTGPAARFYGPVHPAADGAGNLYVADAFNHTIRKITPAGVVTTLAGQPGVAGTNNGTGTAARFNQPHGVGVDSMGNVFVADWGNHTIRKVTTAGVVTTFAGTPGIASWADGTGAAARFNMPEDVAVDGAGNIYVAERENYTIRKITPAAVVTTLAGSPGNSGWADGTGSAARFNDPSGIAVSPTGDLFVGDRGNHIIRKVTAAGVVTTLAGSAGNPGWGDGIGGAARFDRPSGVAVDNLGNVIVTEEGNQTIRQVTSLGGVATIGGSVGAAGTNDGVRYAAQFNLPVGLAVDGAGVLYVADVLNHRISKGVPFLPSWAWIKRIASTVNPDDELAIGLAMDSLANVYVTGWFDGTNDFGGITLTNRTGGGQDIFLGKYNSSGALQWVRRAGGGTASRDTGRGIGVDAAGNVYVTGGFYGNADFDGFNLNASQYHDFFLAKYNSSGSLQWVRQSAGGGDSAYGTGLAVDGVGNCYAVGYFDGNAITFGTTALPNAGDYNVFLVKYDHTGTVQWARAINSPDMTYSTSVESDAAGNVYVAGSFTISMSVATASFTSFGAKDGFLAKFNPAGSLQWARQMGGTSDDAGLGSATVDASGNVFVVGGFGNTSGDKISFGAGTVLTNLGGGVPGAGVGDAFLAKYDSTGNIQWAKRAGTTNMDAYTGVKSDAQGNIYAGGGFGGTGIPRGFKAVVTKYDANGIPLWTQSSSGTNGALVFAGPRLDSGGNSYIAGWFQTNVVFGTNTLTGKGRWDFFLARLGTNAPPPADHAPLSIAGSVVLITITNSDNVPVYMLITNHYDAATYSQSGPNSNTTHSGNYSYAKTGVNLGKIQTVKTSPPSQAGETGTNFLTFTAPSNGLLVHRWPKASGGVGVQTGTFQLIPASPLPPSLAGYVIQFDFTAGGGGSGNATSDGQNVYFGDITYSEPYTYVIVGPDSFEITNYDPGDPTVILSHVLFTLTNQTSGLAYDLDQGGVLLGTFTLWPPIRPSLDVTRNGPDSFALGISSQPGQLVVLEISDDLLNWTEFERNISDTSRWEINFYGPPPGTNGFARAYIPRQ